MKDKKIKHVESLCTPKWSRYTPVGYAFWQVPNMIHSEQATATGRIASIAERNFVAIRLRISRESGAKNSSYFGCELSARSSRTYRRYQRFLTHYWFFYITGIIKPSYFRSWENNYFLNHRTTSSVLSNMYDTLGVTEWLSDGVSESHMCSYGYRSGFHDYDRACFASGIKVPTSLGIRMLRLPGFHGY
jgi:hypothetical protein